MMTSIAFRPTAQATGWPEAVKPCGNSSICSEQRCIRSASSSPRITAPSGMYPQVRHFDEMIASGWMS